MMMFGRDTDSDPIEELTRLSGELRAFRRTLASATRTDTRHQGRDGTGLVTLVANGAGQVRSVEINPDWFAGRGTVDLGPALLEAYQAAMTEAMTASVERIDRAEEEEALRQLSSRGEPSTYSPPPYVRSNPRPTFKDVWAALRELEERQYEREYQRSRRLTGRSTDERVVTGPSRLADITVRGTDVTGITVSSSVGRSRARDLAQDIVLALRPLYSDSAAAGGLDDGKVV
ncbi:YbaB/EbfC family nucleoid-associated protein [Plantactinospora sp. B5E13]|uniref:YbaB/EbfC family nucleoid-associated protein n=1 Tax=unclassified Plantactinospora TaxID=2631981 RepID=UPI00325DA78F